MKITQIIEALLIRLAIPGGRHLYGVLGSYSQLEEFAKSIVQVNIGNGVFLPGPLNVNKGILDSIPDDEFRELAENEAKRPEPTAAHVRRAFERFLRSNLSVQGLLILSKLELLFVYQIELNLLRTMAADENRVLLLLPGKRSGGRVILFHETGEESYILPVNLIADNNLWEIT